MGHWGTHIFREHQGTNSFPVYNRKTGQPRLIRRSHCRCPDYPTKRGPFLTSPFEQIRTDPEHTRGKLQGTLAIGVSEVSPAICPFEDKLARFGQAWGANHFLRAARGLREAAGLFLILVLWAATPSRPGLRPRPHTALPSACQPHVRVKEWLQVYCFWCCLEHMVLFGAYLFFLVGRCVPLYSVWYPATVSITSMANFSTCAIRRYYARFILFA